ncbi:MAG TPA: nuclear transport factor 2 family protein [Thermomicrobiaceae bacterium]|nr:nuclear transport factor 2 family protein [Thermomicrobiaceae bacterium]
MAEPARNLELAFAWVEALRDRDAGRLTRLLAPSVTWRAIGQPPDQLPACTGRDEVVGMLSRGFARHAEAEIEGIELAASGSHALFGRRNPRLVEMNGTPLEGQAYIVMTVDGGTITELRGYAGRGEARRAAGLDPTTDWR